jgi:DNA polymerase-1
MPAQAQESADIIWVDAKTPASAAGELLGGDVSGIGAWQEKDRPEVLWLAVARRNCACALIRADAALQRSPFGRRLTDWLEDARAKKQAHDAKRLMRALWAWDLRLQGLSGDTMIAAYLLNPARSSPDLSDLAEEVLQRTLPAADVSASLGEGLSEQASSAMAQAASALLPLHDRLEEQLRLRDLEKLYREIELPLVGVLSQMERAGVALDIKYLSRLKSQMDSQLLRLSGQIKDAAGVSFNLNSPKQLSGVLFERLKLPVIKRTKTGPSTDSDVLHQLAERHPLPKQILLYRELAKLVSTYVEALPKLADPRTSRLHTTFNQAATATGRLSSSEPNLQNIPIKTELGRSIRKGFVPGMPGGIFLAADYSQIELRVLAHVSGDEQLTEAFRRGRDIHRFTASLIYGIPEPQVQPEQRNAVKAINFGVLYGMTAHGLSRELGVPHDQAQAFIDAYFARYPRVRGYLDSQILKAKTDGFVQTLFGRRRYIPEVNSPDPVMRQFGERMAINAPIQGTAADLIKRAMVDLFAALSREHMKSRMVLQVHDELVLECPASEQALAAALVRRVMEQAARLSVPLTVAVKSGPNWLDLSPLE